MAKRHKTGMSAELRSMINATQKTLKQRYTPPFGTNDRLERWANKLLRQSGFYEMIEPEGFDMAVHHDAVSAHGHLRPTWQGRA